MTEAAAAPPDPAALIRSRGFSVVLVLAAVVGVVASLAAWGFLELIIVAVVITQVLEAR